MPPPYAKLDLSRAELCKVADFDLERLKSLSRRRHERWQLPFVPDDAETLPFNPADSLTPDQEDRVEPHGWRRFTWDNALSLMIMDDFTRNSGVPAQQAASIAGNCADKIRDGWPIIVTEHSPPFFVGFASFGATENSGGAHIGGTLWTIEHKLATGWLDWPGSDVSRLVLSNVSYAARRLRRRAEELRFDIPREFWSPHRFSKKV